MMTGSYSEPVIRRAEMLCTELRQGLSIQIERPWLRVNGIISIFLNSYKPLHNIEIVEALYATMVLYVGCSKEPSH